MPTHKLILDKGQYREPFTLQWDAGLLSVIDPAGATIFQLPVEQAHRLLDLQELDSDGKISFKTSSGPLTFKPNKDAARDVRGLVLHALRWDVDYRDALKHQVRVMLPLGLLAFLICGGLIALYCWWASYSPDPPAGSWIYMFGWLIKLTLLVLGGLALGGAYAAYISLKRWFRIRQAERSQS